MVAVFRNNNFNSNLLYNQYENNRNIEVHHDASIEFILSVNENFSLKRITIHLISLPRDSSPIHKKKNNSNTRLSTFMLGPKG